MTSTPAQLQVADDLLSCLNADTRHTFSGKGLFNRDFQEAFDAVQQAYPSNPATCVPLPAAAGVLRVLSSPG